MLRLVLQLSKCASRDFMHCNIEAQTRLGYGPICWQTISHELALRRHRLHCSSFSCDEHRTATPSLHQRLRLSFASTAVQPACRPSQCTEARVFLRHSPCGEAYPADRAHLSGILRVICCDRQCLAQNLRCPCSLGSGSAENLP